MQLKDNIRTAPAVDSYCPLHVAPLRGIQNGTQTVLFQGYPKRPLDSAVSDCPLHGFLCNTVSGVSNQYCFLLPPACSPVQLKDRNGISRYPATFVDWNAKDKYHPRSFDAKSINPQAITRIKVRGWKHHYKKQIPYFGSWGDITSQEFSPQARQ